MSEKDPKPGSKSAKPTMMGIGPKPAASLDSGRTLKPIMKNGPDAKETLPPNDQQPAAGAALSPEVIDVRQMVVTAAADAAPKTDQNPAIAVNASSKNVVIDFSKILAARPASEFGPSGTFQMAVQKVKTNEEATAEKPNQDPRFGKQGTIKMLPPSAPLPSKWAKAGYTIRNMIAARILPSANTPKNTDTPDNIENVPAQNPKEIQASSRKALKLTIGGIALIGGIGIGAGLSIYGGQSKKSDNPINVPLPSPENADSPNKEPADQNAAPVNSASNEIADAGTDSSNQIDVPKENSAVTADKPKFRPKIQATASPKAQPSGKPKPSKADEVINPWAGK